MARGSGTNTRWRTVVGWSLVLLIAALVPSPFDRRSSWVRFGPDKLLHFVGYGGYAVALARAIGGEHDDKLAAAILSVGLSSLYSHLVGNLQENVPGRKNESADAVAAIVGAVVFVAGWYGTVRSDR